MKSSFCLSICKITKKRVNIKMKMPIFLLFGTCARTQKNFNICLTFVSISFTVVCKKVTKKPKK